MSSASISRLSSVADTGTLRSLLAFVVASVERLAFWTAIALPFLHLSLLSAGLGSAERQTAFALLVVVNVCALLIGHRHRR